MAAGKPYPIAPKPLEESQVRHRLGRGCECFELVRRLERDVALPLAERRLDEARRYEHADQLTRTGPRPREVIESSIRVAEAQLEISERGSRELDRELQLERGRDRRRLACTRTAIGFTSTNGRDVSQNREVVRLVARLAERSGAFETFRCGGLCARHADTRGTDPWHFSVHGA